MRPTVGSKLDLDVAVRLHEGRCTALGTVTGDGYIPDGTDGDGAVIANYFQRFLVVGREIDIEPGCAGKNVVRAFSVQRLAGGVMRVGKPEAAVRINSLVLVVG